MEGKIDYEMEDKIKIGTMFKFKFNPLDVTKYYKITSIRKRKRTNYGGDICWTEIQGFYAKEMKFEKVSSEIMAVNDFSKETKIVETYKLKETNDKPVYMKFYGILRILEEDEQTMKYDIRDNECSRDLVEFIKTTKGIEDTQPFTVYVNNEICPPVL